MLIVFLIFSLFSRQGEQAQIKSTSKKLVKVIATTQDVSEAFDVRLYQLHLPKCHFKPFTDELKDKVTVSEIGNEKYSVLVLEEPLTLPISCKENTHISIKAIRSENSFIASILLEAGQLLRYESKGWVTSG